MNTNKTFPVVLFLLLISYTLLSFIIKSDSKIDEVSMTNKTLKPDDTFTLAKVKKIIEDHFENNITYKPHFYKYISNFEINYLKRSIKPNKVICGDEDWLFLGSDFSDVIEETNCIENFDVKEIEVIKNKIIALRAKLNKHDIEFVIVAAPNKHTIYPEHLPFKISKSGETKLDQLSKTKILGFIDLREILKNNKKRNRLYYKADTHWNAFGGLYGYRKIVDYLNTNFHFQLDVLSDDQIFFDTIYRKQLDLAKMIRIEREEENIKIRIKKSKSHTPIEVTYNRDYPNYKQKRYQAIYKNENCQESCIDKVLFFRDSFGAEIINYLSYNTKELNVFQTQYLDLKYIIDQKPKLVIFEIVERRIEKLDTYLNI